MNYIYPRTSIVRSIKVDSTSQCAFIQIGDTKQVYNRSFAIAAQDNNSTFIPGKHSFADYEIFSREITLPEFEHLPVYAFHHHPCIYVDNIDVVSVAASSSLHVGCVESIFTDSRIMHIRDFQAGPNNGNNVKQQ